MENYFVVDNITKKYDKILAVENVTFSVGKREMVTLLGPSGCGKSTILRCVAGLEKIDDGQIIIDGELVSSAEEKFFCLLKNAISAWSSNHMPCGRICPYGVTSLTL